jgi:hypothetical protein
VIRRCGQEFDVCSTFRLLCNVLLDFWKSPSTTIYGIVQTLCKDFVKGWRRQETSITYYSDPSRTPTPHRHAEYLPLSNPRYYPPSMAICPSTTSDLHLDHAILKSKRTPAQRRRRSPTFCNRGRRDLAKQTNFTVYSAAPMRIKKVLPQISWLLLFFTTQR